MPHPESVEGAVLLVLPPPYSNQQKLMTHWGQYSVWLAERDYEISRNFYFGITGIPGLPHMLQKTSKGVKGV